MIDQTSFFRHISASIRRQARKKKDQFPPRDLNERTNRLLKTLKRTKPTQVTNLSLEEWHRQIKIWLICVPFAQRCCHKAH